MVVSAAVLRHVVPNTRLGLSYFVAFVFRRTTFSTYICVLKYMHCKNNYEKEAALPGDHNHPMDHLAVAITLLWTG